MTTISSAAWRPKGTPGHWLHNADRVWPETNCYLDLWIELLHALGRDPLPLLGVAIGLDWEGDHFTFLKPSSSAIFAATGVVLHEMAIWDEVETHVTTQLSNGSVPLIEVDAFHLPDTLGTAYQQVHTKTTIGITAIDPTRKWIGYIHNAGHFSLCGEDYWGVFEATLGQPTLFPYAELARVASNAPEMTVTCDLARAWAVQHKLSRNKGNPIGRFAVALPDLLARVGQDPARINALCFNTVRQLGSSFGLLADHLSMLGEDGTQAATLASSAKTLQFRIARAARRGRADADIAAALDELEAIWARCLAGIEQISTRSSSDLWGKKTAA